MTTVTAKERPILFSGPMVIAMLEGRKTKTRRVIKPQPPAEFPHALCDRFGICAWAETGSEQDDWWPENGAIRCPYGQPDDKLWVRETWACRGVDYIGGRPGGAPVIDFRADKMRHCFYHDPIQIDGKDYWRPSIFMPRWACRILLEIVSVSVERVQDITENDAKAEGGPDVLGYIDECGTKHGFMTYRQWYKDLWDSLNAKRGFGWKKNPWVWVIEFKRV